jgi:exoribonuclease R
VVADPSSPLGYRLELEPRVESEDWNAEISLLAGMAAAVLMAERGFGLLRVMGGADEYRLTRLRRVAHGLHVEWPEDEPYRDFVDRLDPAKPRDAAILEEARGVMGHASYLYFDGAPPKDAIHAGIAARYAHTTAPLRRLADRYVLDLLAGGGDRSALERLPEAMAEAQTRAGRVEHAMIDLMETRLLEHRIGERFEATPLEDDRRGTVIQIAEPPVRARLHADPPPPLGRRVAVLLVRADPRSRSLEFRPATTS